MTIKEARERAGYSQQKLASFADISINTIVRLERGKPVTRVVFNAVCEALNVETAEITGVVFAGIKKQASA